LATSAMFGRDALPPKLLRSRGIWQLLGTAGNMFSRESDTSCSSLQFHCSIFDLSLRPFDLYHHHFGYPSPSRVENIQTNKDPSHDLLWGWGPGGSNPRATPTRIVNLSVYFHHNHPYSALNGAFLLYFIRRINFCFQSSQFALVPFQFLSN